MQEYEVIAPMGISLHSGNLGLTSEQVRRRAHNLRKNEDGTYSIIAAVMFKRGERFRYDGEVNKAMLMDLGTVEKKKAKVSAASETEDPPFETKGAKAESAKEKTAKKPFKRGGK